MHILSRSSLIWCYSNDAISQLQDPANLSLTICRVGVKKEEKVGCDDRENGHTVQKRDLIFSRDCNRQQRTAGLCGCGSPVGRRQTLTAFVLHATTSHLPLPPAYHMVVVIRSTCTLLWYCPWHMQGT